MIPYNLLFTILEQVDSTNNYAMNLVHNGSAKHSEAFFTHYQTSGKGQRGKIWDSAIGKNILQSIVIEPCDAFYSKPFVLSALISNTIAAFLENIVKESVQVKWPNDIYIRDRKAGGVLIENSYRGNQWKWAIIGMGLNINEYFNEFTYTKPISLIEITEKEYPVVEMAQTLHSLIVTNLEKELSNEDIMNDYNERLYKKNQTVALLYQNNIIHTTIKEVTQEGKLITHDSIIRAFDFGEVQWQLNHDSTG